MRPASPCRLFGAYRAAVGVTDAAIVLHSTIGCSWGTMSFHLPGAQNDVRQMSTVLYEDDVVFGGEKGLRRAVEFALAQYSPPVLFVITGCTPEIMHDDVEGVLREIDTQVPLVHLPGAGFCSDAQAGYMDALLRMVDYMEPGPVLPRHVNLVGLRADTFRGAGELEQLRALLGPEVAVQAVLALDSFANLQAAPRAALNVVFPGFEPVARALEARWGTPYIVADYPYGVQGTDRFTEQVFTALGLTPAPGREAALRRLDEKLKQVHEYLELFYGLPCAVLGSGVEALARVLAQELGMRVHAIDTDSVPDADEVRRRLEACGAALLFGSSFDRQYADALDVPLIPFGYPVFDRISLTGRGYVGYDGLLCLVEDCVNAVMAVRKRRYLYR